MHTNGCHSSMARMPITPSHPHVLRAARKARGITQEKLAQAVGVAAITIQKIESGHVKLSRKLAYRISIVTRLDTQQLLDNSEPDNPRLHPDRLTGPPTQEEIERETKLLADIIRLSLLGQTKTQSQFWVVRYAINQALGELGNEFGLRIKAERFSKKPLLPQASRDSDNGDKRPADRSRVPSPRRSRQHS